MKNLLKKKFTDGVAKSSVKARHTIIPEQKWKRIIKGNQSGIEVNAEKLNKSSLKRLLNELGMVGVEVKLTTSTAEKGQKVVRAMGDRNVSTISKICHAAASKKTSKMSISEIAKKSFHNAAQGLLAFLPRISITINAPQALAQSSRSVPTGNESKSASYAQQPKMNDPRKMTPEEMKAKRRQRSGRGIHR